MFDSTYKTIIQSVLEAETKEFQKKYIRDAIQSSINEDFLEGNVLYRALINRSKLQDLLKNYRSVSESLNTSGQSVHTVAGSAGIFKNVTDMIVTINDGQSYKECLKVIEQYREAAGNQFYGAILRSVDDKNIMINPYHILSALSLVTDDDTNKMKFNIVIYFYKDRDEMDKLYNTNTFVEEKGEANIDALVSTFINKVDTVSKIVSIDMVSPGRASINYKVKKHKDEDRNTEHMIVAHQVIARGIVAPYYGTSLIKLDSGQGTQGMPLSPFSSCNIGCYGSREELPKYGGVCTGGLNNQTLEGLRSLTHANLSSPFGTNLIHPGALAYADMMIDKSVSIYQEAGILQKKAKVVTKDTPSEDIETFKPFKLAHSDIREGMYLKVDFTNEFEANSKTNLRGKVVYKGKYGITFGEDKLSIRYGEADFTLLEEFVGDPNGSK